MVHVSSVSPMFSASKLPAFTRVSFGQNPDTMAYTTGETPLNQFKYDAASQYYQALHDLTEELNDSDLFKQKKINLFVKPVAPQSSPPPLDIRINGQQYLLSNEEQQFLSTQADVLSKNAPANPISVTIHKELKGEQLKAAQTYKADLEKHLTYALALLRLTAIVAATDKTLES